MVFHVTKELNNIRIVNQSIIDSMKAQQARSYKELDRLQTKVHDEADIPSNRFLDWSKIVDGYISSVINSRVIDFELIKRYEVYVKELLNHNKEYLLAQEELERMQKNVEQMLEVVMNAEEQLEKTTKDIEAAKQQLINTARFKKPVPVAEKNVEPEPFKKVVEKEIVEHVEEALEEDEAIEDASAEVDSSEKTDDELAEEDSKESFNNETDNETDDDEDPLPDEAKEDMFIYILGEEKMERPELIEKIMLRRNATKEAAQRWIRSRYNDKFLKYYGHSPIKVGINPKALREWREEEDSEEE